MGKAIVTVQMSADASIGPAIGWYEPGGAHESAGEDEVRLAERVRRLKAEHEGNLLTYGCGEFAFELVKRGLVDEVHFWVHPVVWSEAARPFHGLGHVRMGLKESTAFGDGVVRNIYEPTPPS